MEINRLPLHFALVVAAVPVGQSEDYGTPGSETSLGIATIFEDWGFVSGGIGGQLQLGPLKRQIDQQKFNKEGGMSKSIYKQGGSGYTSGTISVTLSGGGSPTTQAVLTPIIGTAETFSGTVTTAVTGFTVANAGVGYTSTPTVTITDSGSGSGAVAKARINITTEKVTGGYVLQETHSSYQRFWPQAQLPETFEDLGGGYRIHHFQDTKTIAS